MSIKHHMLSSYYAALSAVLAGQRKEDRKHTGSLDSLLTLLKVCVAQAR